MKILGESALIFVLIGFLFGGFEIKTIAEFNEPIAKAIFDQNTGELKEVVLGREPLSPGSYKNEVELPTAVLFYKDGEAIKRVDIPSAGIVRLFHSENGNFIAIQRVFGERQEAGPPNLSGGGEFTLYNSEGEIVWKKDILVGSYVFDAPLPQITLSDLGEFIVWGNGELTYYDLTGNTKEISGGCSGGDWVRVSKDGRFFSVSYNCYGIPTISLFHHSGKLKWRVKSPNHVKVNGIWISPHGKYVVGYHFHQETLFEGKNVKELPKETRRKLLSKKIKAELMKKGEITMKFFRIVFALDSTGQVLWIKKDSEYPSMASQNPYAIFFDESEKFFAQSSAKPRGPIQKGPTSLSIQKIETGELITRVTFSRRYWLKTGRFSKGEVIFILQSGVTGPFFYRVYDMEGGLIYDEQLPIDFIPCFISGNVKIIKGVGVSQNKINLIYGRK